MGLPCLDSMEGDVFRLDVLGWGDMGVRELPFSEKVRGEKGKRVEEWDQEERREGSQSGCK